MKIAFITKYDLIEVNPNKQFQNITHNGKRMMIERQSMDEGQFIFKVISCLDSDGYEEISWHPLKDALCVVLI